MEAVMLISEFIDNFRTFPKQIDVMVIILYTSYITVIKFNAKDIAAYELFAIFKIDNNTNSVLIKYEDIFTMCVLLDWEMWQKIVPISMLKTPLFWRLLTSMATQMFGDQAKTINQCTCLSSTYEQIILMHLRYTSPSGSNNSRIWINFPLWYLMALLVIDNYFFNATIRSRKLLYQYNYQEKKDGYFINNTIEEHENIKASLSAVTRCLIISGR